jgi:hypothetical protein
MATMTRALGANTIETFNVRKTLEFAKPKLVYPQFGQPDLVMRRKGQTASWLRFTKLSVPSSVLADSPTWSPATVSETAVTATLELWGRAYRGFRRNFIPGFTNGIQEVNRAERW